MTDVYPFPIDRTIDIDQRPVLHREGNAMLIHEALARSRRQEAEEQARRHRLVRSLAAGRRWARLAERVGTTNDLPRVQVTAIDARGDVAYHATGWRENVLVHRDVRGRSVYGTVVASDAGELANFDFLSDDLRAGRENAVAWQRVGDLWLVVEGHEWRALDPPP